jgi:U3 small nucleolar RNA-associated protein 20
VLPDRGYTAHVLGYTAAALLEAHVKAGVSPGQLDACVEPLLPTLEGDLFGEVAAAKDVAAFAGKYKEAKRCRAYEAYAHLAAAVTFTPPTTTSSRSSSSSSAFDQLLQLVREKLPAAGSPTTRAKLEQLLTAVARGLGSNPSVTAETLAAWIGVQLDQTLRVEEAARAKALGPVGAAVSTAAAAGGAAAGKMGRGPANPPAAAAATAAAAADVDSVEGEEAAAAAAAAAAAGDGSAHLYLMSHFVLSVLASAMKKGVLGGSSREVLGLLDPLLPLLVRGLGSRHMGTVQASLKCLAMCVSLQHLPGLPSAAVSAGKAVSSLLRKVPDAAHPLAQDCFKLLGGA